MANLILHGAWTPFDGRAASSPGGGGVCCNETEKRVDDGALDLDGRPGYAIDKSP